MTHVAAEAGLSDETLALGVALWDGTREGTQEGAERTARSLMGPPLAALWVAAKLLERRSAPWVVSRLASAIVRDAVFKAEDPYSNAALRADELALLKRCWATRFAIHRPTAPPFALAVLDVIAAAARQPIPMGNVALLAMVLCRAALRCAQLSSAQAAITGAAAAVLACKALDVEFEVCVVTQFAGLRRAALGKAMVALLAVTKQAYEQERCFLTRPIKAASSEVSAALMRLLA